MKKLILVFSFIIAALSSNAQTDARGAAMPPYRILKTDSTWATPANLKHRRTMLIYFSPDCPHCQHLTMDMREKLKQFGDTQIIMITWSNNYDIRAIKNFVRDYNLKKYPNIEIGTEGYSYGVQKYFKIETTPFVAVYDSKGKLTKAFRKQPEVSDLLKAVKVADGKKG
ncbi:thioredoxin-like domain-containing protein [Mucilaginibacter sp. UR6-11]|uniref:TlpA family protein disulfide reductase n=1 Tax=Mucilaginibacter sp. UR6-11 TaxID=1435644 RepID=UPI001E4BE9B2|nr:thioredoxin-like domain-containing protein [Mucilaginibacter sp. UR6-11]MCC8424702.1 thioredoxin family protein [Mucilaginibacter sp. UR6-11]